MSEQTQAIFGIVLIATFITLAIVSRVRRKKSSWKGKVEKKTERNDEGGRSFSVVFRKDDGKKVTLSMKKRDYEKYSEGNKVEKRSGELNPTKI